MGYLLSNRKRLRGSLRAWWLQVAAAGALALCGAPAHAGVISLSSAQLGNIVTLTVTDSNPSDMCIGGACAADFTIGFDPAVLSFIPSSETSSFFFVGAGPGVSGEVLVSFVTFDAADFAGGPEVLFSVAFSALRTEQILVTISPTDFGVVVTDQYLPAAAVATVDVVGPGGPNGTVPEPSTALLAMLALAVLAWRRQTNLAQDQRSLSPA